MTPQENQTEKQQKKVERIHKLIVRTITVIILTILLVAFGLFWQDRYDLLGFTNAFYLSGFLWFVFGWFVLMINLNILAPLIYGVKSFVLVFVAKRPKLDYYEYMVERKENPIAKVFIRVPMLAALLNIVVAIILNMML